MTDSGAMPLSWFDYDLPAERIAQHPASPRDASRLLVMAAGAEVPAGLAHRTFADLPSLLRAGDLLVVNSTQVIKARLGARKPSGGRVELLCVQPVGEVPTATTWLAMARPLKGLQAGVTLTLESPTPAGDGQPATVRLGARRDDLIEVSHPEGRPLLQLLDRWGGVPLPPYIERDAGPKAGDDTDYQTIFAKVRGAVAAPTASLHFTDALLARLTALGVDRAEVVLHVGPGTFLPVRPEHASDVRAHRMHAEWYDIPAATLDRLRARRGRVIAVGTTVVRALETWAHGGAAQGESRLFITPGFTFRAVDAMITNFHLPRSTLLMLVSAFAGRQRTLAAYAEAVRAGYRFFSYGDAMWVEPNSAAHAGAPPATTEEPSR